jgi:hypothetical protein
MPERSNSFESRWSGQWLAVDRVEAPGRSGYSHSGGDTAVAASLIKAEASDFNSCPARWASACAILNFVTRLGAGPRRGGGPPRPPVSREGRCD